MISSQSNALSILYQMSKKMMNIKIRLRTQFYRKEKNMVDYDALLKAINEYRD